MKRGDKPKPFIPAKCNKCNSAMQLMQTPMALMKISARGWGPTTHVSLAGPGLGVYAKRCPHCGYVELYSPHKLREKFASTTVRYRRIVRSVSRN